MFEDLLLWILGFILVYRFFSYQRILLSEASQIDRAAMENAAARDSQQLTRRDIYHVAFLLQQKLPPELVPQIMEQAEFWLKSSVSIDQGMEISDVRMISRRDEYLCPGVTYLSTLPIGEHPGEEQNGIALVGKTPVRKVVFTTVSQDQGWSNFPDDHGTDRGCWTWFEAVVRDPTQPVYQDTVRLLQERSDGDITLPPPPVGREVSRNLHALREWKNYSTAWTVHHEDEQTRHWVGTLERGKIIDLTVWARYPGWRNRVRSASIDVYLAVVR